MTLCRHTALALATVTAGFLALAMLGPGTSKVAAQTASASACDGVSVTPSTRTVRRGGRVLLSGQACGARYASGAGGGRVEIKLRKGKRWSNVATASPDASGEFEACVRVRVPSRTKIARLRVSSASATRTVSVRVSRKGSKQCDSGGSAPSTPPRGGPSGGGSSGGGSSTGGSSGGGSYTPPSDPPANPDCPLSEPNSEIETTLPPSCTVLASDTASSADPNPSWGATECQTADRHTRPTSGGDPGPTAIGAGQGDASHRRLTVIDGDNFWGERCELGRNESRYGTGGSGTFHLYGEGERRVTFFSQRYQGGFDSAVWAWQTVMQMKQTQPYANDGGAGVALELQIFGGQLRLHNFWQEKWSTPAPPSGTWVRYALDVVYSRHSDVGSVKLYVDRNGDGDWLDAGEQSPRLSTTTLATEQSGPNAGQAIPSHLRLGIYHNPSISCPAQGGCPVDVDNVQVVRG